MEMVRCKDVGCYSQQSYDSGGFTAVELQRYIGEGVTGVTSAWSETCTAENLVLQVGVSGRGTSSLQV